MLSKVERIVQIVREVRAEVGMDLEDLAAAARVDASVLTAFETGENSLSTAKLDRIASALGLDALALLEGQVLRRPNATAFFRHARVRDFHDQDTDALVAALEAGRALLEVNKILARPSSLRGQFKPRDVGPVPYEDGYLAARQVRVALKNTGAPLEDLRQILEDGFDVAVCSSRLVTHQLLGATVKDGAGAVGVVISAAHLLSSLAARVTLAHELGHVLLDHAQEDISYVVDIDLLNERRGVDEREQRARAFAAEILMPLLGLRKQFGDPLQIDTSGRALQLVEAARSHFGTPIELAVNHLMNHGYVHRDDEFRRELIETERCRPKTSEMQPSDDPAHGLVEPGLSRALLERVRKAHELMMITDGRARELLGLTVADSLPWES